MNALWENRYKSLERIRSEVAHPVFLEGLEYLMISSAGLPKVSLLNLRLDETTGFQILPTDAPMNTWDYFSALSRREIYVVQSFDKDSFDLTFFDLYARLPLLTHPAIASIVAEFGRRIAENYLDKSFRAEQLAQFRNFFDYAVVKDGNHFYGLGASLMAPSAELESKIDRTFLADNQERFCVITENYELPQFSQIS